MIDDIIAEVCTEILLLSAFTSNIEQADTVNLERDVQLLLSGLSSLAAHAQKIKSVHAGGLRGRGSTASQHTAPHEEPQYEVLQRTESGPNSPHKWVLHVLQDLTTYTRTNGLYSLAESLEKISDRSRDHLSENVPVAPAINCVETDNTVAFSLDRRSKAKGGYAR